MKQMIKGIIIASAIMVAGSQSVAGQTKHQLYRMTEGDYSHWSIAIGGGLDYYRVAPFAKNDSHNFWSYYLDESGLQQEFNPQISIEYTFNPLYGFGIHLGRFGFDRKWRNGELNYGVTKDFTIYGSVDLSDLLAPCRTGFWEDVSLYADVGGGIAFYDGEMAKDNETGGGAYPMNVYNPKYDDPDLVDRKYNGVSPMFTTFLNVEYSLSRHFALALGFGYRWYTRHNMGGWWSNAYAIEKFDGRWQTNVDSNGDYMEMIAFEPMNTDGWNLTLSLRLKVGSGKHKHIRDVRLCGDVDPCCDPTLPARILALENRIGTGGTPCCDVIANGLTEINNNLKNAATPVVPLIATHEGDKLPLGIPANPDDPNAVVGAYIPAIEYKPGPKYDPQGPATGILAGIPGVTGSGTKESPWRIHNVNFVFDKTELISRSNPILQQVLHTLIQHYDEWHVLKIDGHTDWFGTDAYNEDLANRRATTIKQYFINHGLGEKVFITEGFGERNPIAPNETPDHQDDPVGRQENRRVELYIIK